MSDAAAGGPAERWFGGCFGGRPEQVWRAPGRANLIGEHTDYNQGWVLPFALDLGVTVAAGRRGDGVLAIRSRQAPGAPADLPLAALAPGAVTGWAAYPAGVAWALREAGHPLTGGASLAVDSDLPQGPACRPRPRWSAPPPSRWTGCTGWACPGRSWPPWRSEPKMASWACPAGSWTSRRPCSAGPATPCCWTAGPA